MRRFRRRVLFYVDWDIAASKKIWDDWPPQRTTLKRLVDWDLPWFMVKIGIQPPQKKSGWLTSPKNNTQRLVDWGLPWLKVKAREASSIASSNLYGSLRSFIRRIGPTMKYSQNTSIHSSANVCRAEKYVMWLKNDNPIERKTRFTLISNSA